MFRRIRQGFAFKQKERTLPCRFTGVVNWQVPFQEIRSKIRHCQTEGTNAEISMHFATVMPEAGVLHVCWSQHVALGQSSAPCDALRQA